MRKLTTSVGDDLPVISNIISIESKYIPETELSETSKYHYFEVVTFEILDFKGHKYEEVDFSSW